MSDVSELINDSYGLKLIYFRIDDLPGGSTSLTGRSCLDPSSTELGSSKSVMLII